LLLNRGINYIIALVLKAISLTKKVYNILQQKKKIIKIYIENMKDKRYIRNSILQYAILTFIIKKFDKKLYVYVNYRDLNTLTIKNRNIFLLIKKILQKLYKIKFYSKFNIIAIFNKIYIFFRDKYKTIFIICYSLFKYIIMFFKLYNILAIF